MKDLAQTYQIINKEATNRYSFHKPSVNEAYNKDAKAVPRRIGRRSRPLLGFLSLSLLTCTSIAQIIPASRSIDWTQSGVPGGIPNRTTICANISAGASTSTIQSALNACGANNVVMLAAGTYNVSALTIPSGVVLRGSGPQSTILNASGSGTGFIAIGSNGSPNIGSSTAIVSGASSGSNSLVVASSSGISVGSYLMITQLNDATYVWITTSNGTCTWCDGGLGWNGTRVQGQIVEVTSVNGNSIGISPNLYVTYALTPLATPFSMGAKYSGVEDLQVYMNNTGYTANFYLNEAAYSWVKNVESNYTDGDHAEIYWGFRNEIRDSYFHDAFKHTPGSTDTDIFIALKSSANLVENNILRRQHISIMFNWGAAGNVVSYNYLDNDFDSGSYNTMYEGIDFHGAHPMFNLIEGNLAQSHVADFFWGTTSHNTLFRNWFKGVEQIIPPTTNGRAPEQPGAAYWAIQYLVAIDLTQVASSFNLVGNVVGSDRQKTTGTWTSQAVWPAPRDTYAGGPPQWGHSFGYAGPADTGGNSGDRSATYTTALIHGEYDYVLGATTWDGSISNHNLPTSLYRSLRPNWFGSLVWPAFGPDPATPTTVLVGTIPAKSCYDQGRMPNCLVNALAAPTNLRVQ